MNQLPPPLPRPARIEQLGHGWSPRARRFANGVIAWVPTRILDVWDSDYRSAQFNADFEFLRAEYVRRHGQEPETWMARANLCMRATYARVFERSFEGHAFPELLAARPDAEPHAWGTDGKPRHWKDLVKP